MHVNISTDVRPRSVSFFTSYSSKHACGVVCIGRRNIDINATESVRSRTVLYVSIPESAKQIESASGLTYRYVESSLKAAVSVIHTVTDFSIMRRGTEPIRRPPRRQEEANMADVLAQLERSGCIYFVKTLSKTAIQSCETEKTAVLSLPAQFVRENAGKIEQWVILRTHSSCGRSGRPWVVRFSANEAGKALICGGLYAFVTDHRLREGDSLIFVLQEDARSEFEVYTFRGFRRIPRFPNRRDRASRDEENSNINHSSFPSPLHHEDEHKKAFTRDIGEGRTTPLQIAYDRQNHHEIPSFCKRLTASNIGRYDRDPSSNSGQFEFPRRFIRTHGRKVKASVKLQGIHEHSPTHVVFCRRRLADSSRVDFVVTGWSKFVKENGLQKGHELEFSLMADSYFVVRKV